MRLFSPVSAFRSIRAGQLSPERRSSLLRSYVILASRTYNDAVDLLNTLQTPYEVLRQKREAGIRIDKSANEEMRQCLARIGYSQTDLRKLNIVHIAGTKGKGSTCAYVDSILSQYRRSHDIPKKVGLFTSPHLIAVRERIRINSAPISAALFAKYFFEVWDALEDVEKPVYFRYLTLLSYHVFIREGVDAAIYEVGVGGEYDSTNILEAPAVTGITSLGIDHTFTLGNTIEEIAWHKAGIQKPGVSSFSVIQPAGAMKVIEERALERNVESLTIIGEDERLKGVNIVPDAPFQKLNASLAIALAETVLAKLDYNPTNPSKTLPGEFKEGLEKLVWRGRCEKKVEGNVTWYLDGAHTADSIIVAAAWHGFECFEKPGKKVLIFNQQGHREAIELLEGLHANSIVRFDYVIFCPVSSQADGVSKKDFVNRGYDAIAIEGLTLQTSFAEKWHSLDANSTIKVAPSVEDALKFVRELRVEGGVGAGAGADEVHVLITGSVHLVGRALSVLEGIDAV